jgi:hypothetical protein
VLCDAGSCQYGAASAVGYRLHLKSVFSGHDVDTFEVRYGAVFALRHVARAFDLVAATLTWGTSSEDMLTERSRVEKCRHRVEPTLTTDVLDVSLRLTAVHARPTRRLSFPRIGGFCIRGIATLGWLRGIEVEAMAAVWCWVNCRHLWRWPCPLEYQQRGYPRGDRT